MADKRPLLALIDGSHAVFRAYFAVRGLTAPDGRPTGALFGFVSMLMKIQRERAPTRLAVCFDTAAPTFRHHLLPTYKANRPAMPEDLAAQWPIALELVKELGLPLLVQDGLEADDLIATLAVRAHAAGWDVLVVSSDKDLMQLVVDAQDGGPRIAQLDDQKETIFDAAGVTAKWGVPPDRVGDLLAIMGDASDNVPGVKGVGEKGAVKLLQQFGSLDAIYARLDEVESPRTRELLQQSAQAARTARQVVALVTDAAVPWTLDDLAPREPDRPALVERFAQLGFKRLLKDQQDHGAAPTAAVHHSVVTDALEMQGIAEQIRASRCVALCTVTNRADPERVLPMWGDLVGVGLQWSPLHTAYLPLRPGPTTAPLWAPGPSTPATLDLFAAPQPPARSPVLTALAAVLEDAGIAKVSHHAKYDDLVLRRHGVRVRGWAGDPMLASYLCEPEKFTHSLRNIAFHTLGVQLADDADVLGRGKAQVQWGALDLHKAADHVAERAALAGKCERALRSVLDAAGTRALYDDLEVPLATVLADCEWAGIAIDVGQLAEQSLWLEQEAAVEERAIHQLAGRAFSIGSPQQLGVVLFEELKLPAKKRTQTGWSTDQSVLEALHDAHPICARVLRWRQLSKLKGTYTDALPALVHPQTGRLHTCFQQAVAATGRLASTDPNLQNIPIRTPEGRRIRSAFVAPPGHALMSADYSQIELRVMAHLADDPGLIGAFRSGHDIHRQTAAQIFGVMPALVTTEQRAAAKTINFGVLYGMGPQRLGREINVSLKEAKAFIDRYFERFPAVNAWIEGTLETARRTGEVRTLFGRRRPVPGLVSNAPAERAAAERVAVNTPVQGTAADLIKRAMLAVHRDLGRAGLRARLLLQVHDELVLEVPHAEIDDVTALVRAAMAGVADLKVPLQVDVGTGPNWADAH
ncbi:MAG: DNA polymerase I [Myxococcales bacterium]|nr:DNA polymerase I [Myxococcales bacterium]